MADLQQLLQRLDRIERILAAANLQPEAPANLNQEQQAAADHLLRLCQDFCTEGPPASLNALRVSRHDYIPRLELNPVPGPVGQRRWGEAFDVADTAQGQNIRQALGGGSGFYLEYRSWAPVVSALVDLTAHLMKITAHPALPGDARQLFGPIATGLEHITRQSVGLFDVHRLHANFAGMDAAGAWKVA